MIYVFRGMGWKLTSLGSVRRLNEEKKRCTHEVEEIDELELVGTKFLKRDLSCGTSQRWEAFDFLSWDGLKHTWSAPLEADATPHNADPTSTFA